MASYVAILLLATVAVSAEALPSPRSSISVNDTGYIAALLNAAAAKIEEGSVTVSENEYVVEFKHVNKSHVLVLYNIGLNGSFPSVTAENVMWWGNSTIFHVYADALLGNHTVVYSGKVGLPNNLLPISINATLVDYRMSTYKKFVYNATTSAYDLKVHILDAKIFGKHHYNISITGGDESLYKRVHEFIHHVDLKNVRDYSLTYLTDYVLAIMDDVDIADYISTS